MKNQIANTHFPLKVLSLAVAFASQAYAQDSDIAQAPRLQEQAAPAMEEVVTLGRLRDSAAELVIERLEQEVVTDVIGAEAIGRIGDSTVGAALRRVPGVTLVDDKFVYVRGLGERYSSTFLNGAVVPSPDLTRNVIPLDIFPTSIVESLAIQKSYSADTSAAFGGGSVNVRTKGIPDSFTYNVELGTSFDSETTGDVLSYNGGTDDWLGTDDGTRALPSTIATALDTYLGQLANAPADINRQLATELNRDIQIGEKSYSPDTNVKASLGNNFVFNNGMELGFLAGGTYKNGWTNADNESHGSLSENDYADIVTFERKSTYAVNATANLNFGLRLNEENVINTTSLYIRNTDDEVSISDVFDENRRRSDNEGFRQYETKYEERELRVNQINGDHTLGYDTLSFLNLSSLSFLEGTHVKWFYSDSESTTNIPGESTVSAEMSLDSVTGETVAESVRNSTSAAEFRYTDLEDQVESYGWSLSYPISLSNTEIELAGGYEYSRKARTYRQIQLQLGTTNSNDYLSQGVNTALSNDAILDASNGYQLSVVESNAQSYLAATTLNATFGKFDVTFNDTWRVSAGLRYEEYQQVALPWNPLAYTSPQITMNPDDLERAVFMDDDVYPSASLVYMNPGFWAEDFQLRFGYSETVVRPDLREVSDSSYRDPITDATVFGNPDVTPSSVKNYDARAEWFFDDGDNLTVSLFYKDITNPIEFFEAAATDNNTAYEIHNADSGEVAGMEVEFLKNLGSFNDALSAFFLSGNVTAMDSELVAGSNADSPTNANRKLQGASDYAANLQLGFDSDNGQHSAMLVYNIFGERLYYAGRLGSPDAYEQPFNSVDLTYSYYPTDSITLKLKLQNLLNENTVIERAGFDVYEKQVGVSGALSLQYKY